MLKAYLWNIIKVFKLFFLTMANLSFHTILAATELLMTIGNNDYTFVIVSTLFKIHISQKCNYGYKTEISINIINIKLIIKTRISKFQKLSKNGKICLKLCLLPQQSL